MIVFSDPGRFVFDLYTGLQIIGVLHSDCIIVLHQTNVSTMHMLNIDTFFHCIIFYTTMKPCPFCSNTIVCHRQLAYDYKILFGYYHFISTMHHPKTCRRILD